MCRNWCFYKLRRFCITNSSIYSLSFFCRVFPLALFFCTYFHFVFCFYLFFFFFQEWGMTWVASSDCMTDCCQNWSFKNSGDLNITKSLKCCFSLFCRVLLLRFFFFLYLFLFRVYFVVTNYITILLVSSACITDCCQKLVLLKALENLVLRTI